MKAAEYNRASHAIWQAMASGWEERHAYFEEISRPVTDKMLEMLEPSPGETILDLAAGTGAVGFTAAQLVGPTGRVIVSDFAEAMVDIATRRAEDLGFENIECVVLDAEQLDLPDASADGVVCRWGYMLMGDPGAAFRETRRVLRDGGRAVAAVFAGPEQNPWAAIPGRVLQQRGHVPSPEAGAPGILSLGDQERLRRLFTDAGFADPSIEPVGFRFDYDGMDAYWEFLSTTAGAIAMVLQRLGSDEQNAIRGEITEALGISDETERIELPAVSLVAAAA